MTLGLFIDSSSDNGLVALFEGDPIKLHLVASTPLANANNLMTEIDKLMVSSKRKAEELTFVAAGVGPGSFTGIRVAQMVARSLSFAASIPLLGLSSLLIYSEEFPVISDARIGGVWAQFPGGEAQMIPLSELVNKLEGYKTVISPDIKQLKGKLETLGYQGEFLEKKPDIALIATQISRELLADKGIRPEIAYLRKTQAEIERDLINEQDRLKK